MCSSYSQTHRGHTRAWSTQRKGFSSPPAQSGNLKWHSKHSIWQLKQTRTVGPWSSPASQSCSFACLSCSSSHSYITENVLSCFHPTFLAFNSIRSISISLQTLLLLYGSALYRGLFRVYVETLSNPSWKLLGCDQRPYKSDSLINIKHSVRKKEST